MDVLAEMYFKGLERLGTNLPLAPGLCLRPALIKIDGIGFRRSRVFINRLKTMRVDRVSVFIIWMELDR